MGQLQSTCSVKCLAKFAYTVQIPHNCSLLSTPQFNLVLSLIQFLLLFKVSVNDHLTVHLDKVLAVAGAIILLSGRQFAQRNSSWTVLTAKSRLCGWGYKIHLICDSNYSMCTHFLPKLLYLATLRYMTSLLVVLQCSQRSILFCWTWFLPMQAVLEEDLTSIFTAAVRFRRDFGPKLLLSSTSSKWKTEIGLNFWGMKEGKDWKGAWVLFCMNGDG